MNRNKKAGTAWESAIVAFLRTNGAPHCERRASNGAFDRGDITGIPGVVIEAKSGAFHMAAWDAEVRAEMTNDAASIGVVWAKRAGKTSPADGYLIMPPVVGLRLLTAAGYLGQPDNGGQ
ncbi:MAG TPA: hypothetical protein VK453_24450 [Micromonosporaceae bacterium]|nr:hypothetical protein [Micromonosporaceae bacterium]